MCWKCCCDRKPHPTRAHLRFTANLRLVYDFSCPRPYSLKRCWTIPVTHQELSLNPRSARPHCAAGRLLPLPAATGPSYFNAVSGKIDHMLAYQTARPYQKPSRCRKIVWKIVPTCSEKDMHLWHLWRFAISTSRISTHGADRGL